MRFQIVTRTGDYGANALGIARNLGLSESDEQDVMAPEPVASPLNSRQLLDTRLQRAQTVSTGNREA